MVLALLLVVLGVVLGVVNGSLAVGFVLGVALGVALGLLGFPADRVHESLTLDCKYCRAFFLPAL